MFKRTRRKIVASIMAILIFVFVAILALIYGSSYYETMNRNREMLESHAEFFSLTDISDNYKENDLGPDIVKGDAYTLTIGTTSGSVQAA